MKIAMCVQCGDLIAPLRHWSTNRSWRWCQCEHVGTRWRDGERGLLEVTAINGPDDVRVIGLNNAFLAAATAGDPASPGGRRTAEQWRALHRLACEQVPPSYVFHQANRGCWAAMVRVGETGDVFFVEFGQARYDRDGSR